MVVGVVAKASSIGEVLGANFFITLWYMATSPITKA
jgi:hypothetical protein